MKKIRVLVVDDSAFMRKMIEDLLFADPEIEVVDKARNGKEGIDKVKDLNPDVVTMDIEMPIMNGLDALQFLMRNNPVPVVMLSSLTQDGATETLKALELGAVDFVPKPSGSISLDIHKVQVQLIQTIKAAANARINRAYLPAKEDIQKIKSRTVSVIRNDNFKNMSKIGEGKNSLYNIILVGTSTGGPKALQTLLSSIPKDTPAAFLIVQHMPPGFTKSLSQRLDSLSEIQVVEAEDGMVIKTGVAYVAPGDFHMETKKNTSGDYVLSLNKNEPRSGHRPSVDVLFESTAKLDHPSKYAVIMTGMGNDGTKGVQALKMFGCKETIAEDESTCVVYGMPRAAVHSGSIDRILPLHQIGPYLTKILKVKS